jgi:hypothetical protein
MSHNAVYRLTALANEGCVSSGEHPLPNYVIVCLGHVLAVAMNKGIKTNELVMVIAPSVLCGIEIATPLANDSLHPLQ